MQLTEATVRGRLAGVEDPFLGGSVLDLGLVTDVAVDATTIHVSVALNAPHAPDERRIGDRIRDALSTLDRSVRVYADPPTGVVEPPLPNSKNVILVTASRQRVGHTAVAVNVAADLASRGAAVGVLDAHSSGTGVRSLLEITEDVQLGEAGELVPVGAEGLQVVSVTDVLGENPPRVERTAVGDRLVAGLLHDVEWQALDYLFVVAPPLAEVLDNRILDVVPATGAVVVRSPETAPADDATRNDDVLVDHGVPVLGVVENTTPLPSRGRLPDWGGRPPTRIDPTGVPCLGAVSLEPSDGVVAGAADESAAAVSALADAVTNQVGALHRLTACAAATEQTESGSDCSTSVAGCSECSASTMRRRPDGWRASPRTSI